MQKGGVEQLGRAVLRVAVGEQAKATTVSGAKDRSICVPPYRVAGTARVASGSSSVGDDGAAAGGGSRGSLLGQCPRRPQHKETTASSGREWPLTAQGRQ